MKDMKTTENLVKELLQDNVLARNNDDYLTLSVYSRINPEVVTRPLQFVLTNRKALGLPSLKSIERARRKLQRKYPELSANAIVEAFREQNEKDYIAYARGELDE